MNWIQQDGQNDVSNASATSFYHSTILSRGPTYLEGLSQVTGSANDFLSSHLFADA
jgi:hypothetical protein